MIVNSAPLGACTPSSHCTASLYPVRAAVREVPLLGGWRRPNSGSRGMPHDWDPRISGHPRRLDLRQDATVSDTLLTLEPVSQSNVREICSLRVAPHQERLVS